MGPDGMNGWRTTRRRFLYLSGLTITGVVATACGGDDELPGQTPRAVTPGAQATTGATQPQRTATGQQTAAGTPQPTGAAQPTAAPSARKEAPQFAQMVKEGKLPPVDQRLPRNPMTIKPVEQAGKYGGAWRTALLGGQDTAWLVRTIDYEHLTRWDPEWKEVLPNVAASFETDADAKTYTFKLREGLKWSDGKPYTADDIVFWYEDIMLNKELSPGGFPEYMVTGEKPGKVEKVDQHTVRFVFDQPNGLFLQRLATPAGDAPTRYPAHYLKQFHQKYNTTNLNQLIQQNNADSWVKLFQLKGAGVPGTPYDARWQNAELPTLMAWQITEPYGGNAQRVVAERNPYFYKVDTEGNQLPYLDRVVFEVHQDKETLVLKAANGEIDMMDRHIATNQNKAVFFDNQQKGNYHFFETVPSSMNDVIIALNLTHKDPVMRQVFQNKDFRIGLSHAINRAEIIDVVYVGQGEPFQAAPRPTHELYNERLAKQYTEYDVKKANEFLDKAFPRKNAAGIRLGPNGNPITFAVEVTAATGTERLDALGLVVRHWKEVGIDAQVKDEDRALLYTRKNANEHDAVVWGGDGGLDVILEPRYYFPYSTESNFAQAWSVWFNPGGNPRVQPEEPPPPVKQQMDLYNQLKATGDQGKQNELMKQILEIAADQFYVIGISLPPNGYGIVKNNMKNVPKSMPGAWLYPNPAPTNPQQYFYDK